MPFCAALSTHPVSSHATGEVIGQVIEEVGAHPDVALLFATPGHAGALEDIAAAVQRLLAPSVLIGATSSALIGQGADDAGRSALALWVGVVGPVWALRLGTGGYPAAGGSPQAWSGPPASGAVVLVDPVLAGRAGAPGARAGEPPGTGLAGWLAGAGLGGRGAGAGADVGRWPAGPGAGGGGLPAGAGGTSPAPSAPVVGAGTAGGPLLLGQRLVQGGAVGVAFAGSTRFDAVTARAWRAVGPPLRVTELDAERGLVRRLDGVPALDRLRRLAADEVPAEVVPLINHRLGIGPEDGDGGGTAVVEVQGADRSDGALAAGPLPGEDRPVYFWVRGDPGGELRRRLAGRRADTAVAFVADPVSRGYRSGDHDAEIIADALGTSLVTGLVAPLQLGPVGGRLRALEGEASVALLSDP